jgi:phosphoglucosamine mutase
MTAEMALALGRAIAHVFRQRGENGRFRVIIGKDTRRSGYMFESALTSGICSMGGDVLQVGPMPTPGMAFLTTDMRCDAGVMISASHNPYEDNGIKFFSSDGFKLPDKIEDEIERLISSRELEKTGASADRVGRARRLDDVLGRYVVFLKKTFPRDLTLDGLRVVVDCANGAAYKVAPTVLGELGAEVFTAGVDPDGYNINAGVGSLYPDTVAAKVREVRAEVGIALDGDADRCVLIDENGSIVDGDQILAICARDMQERGVLKGSGVVATVMSNIGLERSLAEVDLNLIRCKVGDRYVVEGMREGGFNLGGEQSGHTIFLDENTTGDGTMSALRVLAIMKKKGRRLSELASVMTRYPQAIRNVRVARKPALESVPKLRDAVKQAEADLRGTGRVLFRYSGTEPKARVMVEGEDAARIERLADDLAALANEQLSDAS